MKKSIIHELLTIKEFPQGTFFESIIKSVRDNEIFNEIIANVKEDFFVDDLVHGLQHNERVTLMACYMGIQQKLTDNEMRILLYASLYHDIGRKELSKGTKGIGRAHGFKSAEILENNATTLLPNMSKEDMEVVKGMCIAHSVDDSDIVMELSKIGLDASGSIGKIIAILKDADALDRVRLPRNGLDESYLRTNEAKQMAREAFSHKLVKLCNRIAQGKVSASPDESNEGVSQRVIQMRAADEEKMREQLQFDGENYYLYRSLNERNIEARAKRLGFVPQIGVSDRVTLSDVVRHSDTNSSSNEKFISMTTDPNIVLTYNKRKLNRFILIRLSRDEVITQRRFFSAGDYLLYGMQDKVQEIMNNMQEDIKKDIQQIFDQIDSAENITAIETILDSRKIKNSLIRSKKYLDQSDALVQCKSIAKCLVLQHYKQLHSIEESLKTGDVSRYTGTMRVAYHNAEWITKDEIEADRIIDIPMVVVDVLALVRQAEYQAKSNNQMERLQQLKSLEQKILVMTINHEFDTMDLEPINYKSREEIKREFPISQAFEISDGKTSYRTACLRNIAVKSVAEMTMYKRELIQFMQKRISANIDIADLLDGAYCVNRDMVTRRDNRGRQNGQFINFEIADMDFVLDDDECDTIFRMIESLSDAELKSIVDGDANLEVVSDIINFPETNPTQFERLRILNGKRRIVRYYTVAIVDGYSWQRKLSKNEKEKISKIILPDTVLDSICALYDALIQVKMDGKPLSQDDVFAAIINMAIDKQFGKKSYKEIIGMSEKDVKEYIEDNLDLLKLSIEPITVDVTVGNAKAVEKFKESLRRLGVSEENLTERKLRNAYTTKKMVDSYFKSYRKADGTEITDTERGNLINALISNSVWENSNMRTLMRKLQDAGLNEMQQYGFIMRLAVYGSNEIGTYSEFSSMMKFLFENVKKLVEDGQIDAQCEVSDDIFRFMESSKNALKFQESAEAALEEQGYQYDEPTDSIITHIGEAPVIFRKKDTRNIAAAIKIATTYCKEHSRDDGSPYSDYDQAAIASSLIALKTFDKTKSYFLDELIRKLANMGLNEEQQYRFIIGLSSTGVCQLCTYTSLVKGERDAINRLQEFVKTHSANDLANICEVTEETINCMIYNERARALQDVANANLEAQGYELNDDTETITIKFGDIEIDFESKMRDNMAIILEIVNRYCEMCERNNWIEIDDETKANLVKVLMSPSTIRLTRTACSVLARRLYEIGLNDEQLCLFWVRHATEKFEGINTYGVLLNGSANAIKELRTTMKREAIEKICQYSGKTFQALASEGRMGEFSKKAMENLEKLKYSYDSNSKITKFSFEEAELSIENMDLSTVANAIEIVNRYCELVEVEATNDRKALYVKAVLNCPVLKQRGQTLLRLVELLYQKGLNDNQVYGFIINLALNRENKIGTYKAFLAKDKKTIKLLDEYIAKDNIDDECIVTEHSVQKEINNSNVQKVKMQVQKKFNRKKHSESAERYTSEIRIGNIVQTIERRKKTNVDTAIQIVNEYFDWYSKNGLGEVSDEERAEIVKIMVSPASFGNEAANTFTPLLTKLKLINLTEQQIYGFIIRLAIEKNNGLGAYTKFINGTLNPQQIVNEQGIDAIVQRCEVSNNLIQGLTMSDNSAKERFQIESDQNLDILDRGNESGHMFVVIRVGNIQIKIVDKNIKNVSAAVEIAERFSRTHRNCSDKESDDQIKVCIIRAILEPERLGNRPGDIYLRNLIGDLEQMGLNEDQQALFIVKSAIEGNGLDSYSNYLSRLPYSMGKLKTFIETHDIQKEMQVRTDALELKAIQLRLADLENELVKNLSELGCEYDRKSKQSRVQIGEEHFKIEGVGIRNVVLGINLINNYFKAHGDKGTEYSDTEKAGIIMQIFSNNLMKHCWFSTMLARLQMLGLDEDMQAGLIINWAAHGSNKAGSYSDFLMMKTSVFTELQKMAKSGNLAEECLVRDKTIHSFETAKKEIEFAENAKKHFETLNTTYDELARATTIKFGDTAITINDDDTILKNIAEVAELVNMYCSQNTKKNGESYSTEEQAAFFRAIMSNASLRIIRIRNVVGRLYEAGLNDSLISGFMINLAVQGKCKWGSYTELLHLRPAMIEKIEGDIAEGEIEECRVMEDTPRLAIIERLVENFRNTAQSNYNQLEKNHDSESGITTINLGDSQLTFSDIDEINMAAAIEIVRRYCELHKKEDGSIISDAEKTDIINCILATSSLHIHKGGAFYLDTLLKKLYIAGISEEQQWGFVIKSAIEGNGLGSYSNFIKGDKKSIGKVHECVASGNIGPKCEITDSTIQKAKLKMQKAKATMKHAVADLKNNNQIGSIEDTIRDLEELSNASQFISDVNANDTPKPDGPADDVR